MRKRIAQYYHEPGRDAEIRIELPAGSYVPEFHYPGPRTVEISEPSPEALRMPLVLRPDVGPYRDRYLAGCGGCRRGRRNFDGGRAGGGRGPVQDRHGTILGPGLGRTDSVLVCLGVFQNRPTDGSAPPADPTHRQVMWNDRVAFADAVTMAKLAGLLQAHGKQYDIRGSSTLTLEDMHKSPTILIGAFDNPWTLALSHRLRFTFEFEPAGRLIRDRQNPANVAWHGDFQRPYSQVTEDYAVVSRYKDPEAERMMVVVAGMGKDGTAAAGEFVTDAHYLEALSSKAPANWEHKNLQVVLATEVINGNPGPPRVLATYFW